MPTRSMYLSASTLRMRVRPFRVDSSSQHWLSPLVRPHWCSQVPSTTHRVVNPDANRRHLPRYSMPFFLHYRPDWLIEPFTGSAAMPPILAHDFLTQRLTEIKLS